MTTNNADGLNGVTFTIAEEEDDEFSSDSCSTEVVKKPTTDGLDLLKPPTVNGLSNGQTNGVDQQISIR